MAQTTNMDHSKDTKSNIPQLEFTLPRTEFDEQVYVGDLGKVTIPVEVTMITKDAVSFRKRGKSEQAQFKAASLDEMEDHINEQHPPKDE